MSKSPSMKCGPNSLFPNDPGSDGYFIVAFGLDRHNPFPKYVKSEQTIAYPFGPLMTLSLAWIGILADKKATTIVINNRCVFTINTPLRLGPIISIAGTCAANADDCNDKALPHSFVLPVNWLHGGDAPVCRSCPRSRAIALASKFPSPAESTMRKPRFPVKQ
jgi:hypothetical protein